MMWLILFPFGGALAARLMYKRWQAWAAYGGTYLLASMVLWFGRFSFNQALVMAFVASVIGFVGPELWEAVRSSLRRPKTLGWLLGGCALAFVTWKNLWMSLMTISIMLLGIKCMFRALFPKRKTATK
jgi:chromate transport protein ChrA